MNLSKELIEETEKIRKDIYDKEITPPFFEIEDLPLTNSQQKCVLEWFARKLMTIRHQVGNDDWCGKSYDPLRIKSDNSAMSYLFNLEDGGRNHTFKDLNHLEEMLMKETIEICNTNSEE